MFVVVWKHIYLDELFSLNFVSWVVQFQSFSVMAATKVYTDAELLKMTKGEMKRILKQDYGKTDDELRLGWQDKQYCEMIKTSQGSDKAASSQNGGSGGSAASVSKIKIKIKIKKK